MSTLHLEVEPALASATPCDEGLPRVWIAARVVEQNRGGYRFGCNSHPYDPHLNVLEDVPVVGQKHFGLGPITRRNQAHGGSDDRCSRVELCLVLRGSERKLAGRRSRRTESQHVTRLAGPDGATSTESRFQQSIPRLPRRVKRFAGEGAFQFFGKCGIMAPERPILAIGGRK